MAGAFCRRAGDGRGCEGVQPIPADIFVTDQISISEDELSISFIRSPGPGGQNTNKVSSAAQLRFDLKHSPSLPDALKRRAAALAGSRLTKDGEIVITATQFRAQPQNKADAIARLVEILREASIEPKYRRPTRPTLASKKRRIEGKVKRGETKRLRSGKPEV
jgi:ribosome-associated protein